MEKVFIGVGWPYANGPLHLGHVAGSLLPSDIFARYHRLKGDEVLMVSGSDEHGTPITLEAERAGKKPQEFAGYYHEQHKKNLSALGISFDLFFRTSSPHHKKVAQKFFSALLKKDWVYKKTTLQLYCKHCARWLSDRYVRGSCPKCGYQQSRGDQCEACNETLDATELLNPVCKVCGKMPKRRRSEHFFLRLTAFKAGLLEYLEDKKFWKENVYRYTKNCIRALKDRPITRDMEWGIEVPVECYEGKRLYVWFEAVIGYLSASQEWTRRTHKPWEPYWKDKHTKHYYFIGKDNIPFHTIIWPAMLMAHGGLNLPHDVPANEYLTLKGEDFSKSRKRAIWVPEYLNQYEPDSLRYYLSINMPDKRDVDFSWHDFIEKNNKELVGTLGNFIHRTLSFAYKNFGVVPQGKLDSVVQEHIEKTYTGVSRALDRCRFKSAIKEVMSLARYGNQYLSRKEPWKLINVDKRRCAGVIYNCLRMVKCLAVLVSPFLPFSAQKLLSALGYGKLSWQECKTELHKVKLQAPKPLFKKIER